MTLTFSPAKGKISTPFVNYWQFTPETYHAFSHFVPYELLCVVGHSSDCQIPGRFALLMLCPCYRSLPFQVFHVSPRPREVTICIQLYHTRSQRTAGIKGSFMVNYASVTLRNRLTERTSLAGKSHRPTHLPIRTPSTRERERFTIYSCT